MATKFHNSLFSDIIPSTYAQRKHHEAASASHRLNTESRNSRVMDIVPGTYAQRKHHEAASTSHRLNYDRPLNVIVMPHAQRARWPANVLSHWSLKYVGGLVVVATVLLFAVGGRDNGQIPVTAHAIGSAQIESEQKVVTYGLPARLKIPKINVDTTIEQLGLTSQAEMAAPEEPTLAGWFKYGPRPGEVGSSVIAGHYGYGDHVPAVFDALGKLQKGDKLYIEDDQGRISTFVVRYSQRYNPDADAVDVFKSNDGLAHLNLITCEGAWNEAQNSYSTRLVVFTDKL